MDGPENMTEPRPDNLWTRMRLEKNLRSWAHHPTMNWLTDWLGDQNQKHTEPGYQNPSIGAFLSGQSDQIEILFGP